MLKKDKLEIASKQRDRNIQHGLEGASLIQTTKEIHVGASEIV